MNLSRSALFHMKAGVCLKYFVNDCGFAEFLKYTGKLRSVAGYCALLFNELSNGYYFIGKNICCKNILCHFSELIFANLSQTPKNKFCKYSRITIGKNKFGKIFIEFPLVFLFSRF